MWLGRANWANAAARARSRRSRLLDRTRIRQLLKLEPDGIANTIGDAGYRADMDLYGHRLSGAELVEAALSHNLDREVHEVDRFCNGELADIVDVWALRIDFNKAKAVLRAVKSEADSSRVGEGALPAENPHNARWISIIDSSSNLAEAASSIEKMKIGTRIFSDVPPESGLAEYEDALVRSYYRQALKSIPSRGPHACLKRYLRMEIAHRDVLNVMRAMRQGLSNEKRAQIFVPGSGLSKATEKALLAAQNSDDVLAALRRTPSFDDEGLEAALAQVNSGFSLDPVVDLFHHKRSELLLRFSHLNPISGVPIVYYIERKLLEVENLRLLVRGKAAGLPEEIIEAHLTL
jgi:V/A-type H+-transporting ATPase subunit C